MHTNGHTKTDLSVTIQMFNAVLFSPNEFKFFTLADLHFCMKALNSGFCTDFLSSGFTG